MNRIQTGDRVGADWIGPKWTPFAQAIADDYGVQVPWFFNTPVTLGTPPARVTVTTKPQQHDVLIFGAHVLGTATQLPFVFLQITHNESGVPWAVPNVVPFVPLTAFAGVNVNAMPNLKLPEAFFLPARTTLKLDWTVLAQAGLGSIDPITLTLIGVQLINPRGMPSGSARLVRMPDGKQIRTDSRLPLFLTMGLGDRQANGTFFFDVARQRVQFLPPLDCNAEIHDLSTNLISAAFTLTPDSVDRLAFKLTVMGVERQWTPYLAPAPAVFGGAGGGTGGATQVFPALPYTKPYLLLKDRRIQIAMQNNSIATTFTGGYLTFRGVRLCEY